MSNKIAHKPIAFRDPDVMLYMIDSDSNKSKFYEMKVVPKGQETPAKSNKDLSKGSPAFVLMRRWGRLTDSVASGRVDSENDTFASNTEARRAMDLLERQKRGKGYQVAERGVYPIGLGGAGFGWGGQAACEYIPELHELQTQLADMQNSSRRFSRILHELKQMRSSLVDTISPMYDNLLDDIAELNSVLEGQLSKCRAISARKYASGCGDPKPGQKIFLSTERGMVSLMTIPTDPPYCQTYRVTMLTGPTTAVAIAHQIAPGLKNAIEKMEIVDAYKFLDAEIQKRLKRPMNLKWHTFYMPD